MPSALSCGKWVRRSDFPERKSRRHLASALQSPHPIRPEPAEVANAETLIAESWIFYGCQPLQTTAIDGTYGQCLIDGGPIDPKRLEDVPWTPYCIKHQKLLEAASRPKQAL